MVDRRRALRARTSCARTCARCISPLTPAGLRNAVNVPGTRAGVGSDEEPARGGYRPSTQRPPSGSCVRKGVMSYNIPFHTNASSSNTAAAGNNTQHRFAHVLCGAGLGEARLGVSAGRSTCGAPWSRTHIPQRLLRASCGLSMGAQPNRGHSPCDTLPRS